ncbi:hypothetical protein CBR_g4817 [Chara braunii]|uniref:Tyr recombinase domain-containing protein n=1 Tax=Chara braunii TaxID=69332 RepID=A0A388KIX8_CHABU|nr:hypothetical protein CBR_g4817 [Chara braunii]|eukprot:GBG69989.1 hypothetical protein CBR_g4817 [Chara braunii]
MQCNDLDVLSFVSSQWLVEVESRCRTSDAAALPLVSPSTVDAALNCLSACFRLLGRDGEGDPCQSSRVRSFRKAYREYSLQRGVVEESAVALTWMKLERVMRFIRDKVKVLKGHHEAQAHRDGGAFLYLWESWQRCGEGLRLQYKEIDLEKKIVRPGYTKTDRHGGRFMIRLRDAGGEEETFLGWLPEMVSSYEQVGQDIKQGFLFRPMWGSGAMSGGAFNKRIEKWYVEAGVFAGESGHSFRIGGVQAGIEEGWSLCEMMRQGTWSSVGTFMRYGYGMRRGWKRRRVGESSAKEDGCEAEDSGVEGVEVDPGAREAREFGVGDSEAAGDREGEDTGVP